METASAIPGGARDNTKCFLSVVNSKVQDWGQCPIWQWDKQRSTFIFVICVVLPSPLLRPCEVYQVVKALFGFETPAGGYQQTSPVLNGPLDGCVNLCDRLLRIHIEV